MPNGNPDFEKEELPLLEAFFEKISSVLESFSIDHNLLIEKYYHEPVYGIMSPRPPVRQRKGHPASLMNTLGTPASLPSPCKE